MYIPLLEKKGFEISVNYLLGDNYISYLYEKTKLPIFEIIFSYLKRIMLLLFNNKFDIIWIEQEAFPWMPPFFEKLLLTRQKKVMSDYDDAFFHRYDLHNNKIVRRILGQKIDMVMNRADIVLAGNEYLAERARKNNMTGTYIFPTVVDTQKFVNQNIRNDKIFTIGWIGTPGNIKYLKTIEPALEKLSAKKNVKISIVGAGNVEFKNFTVNNIKWSEQTEVSEISKFDVGIMPLLDSPWERGKCGFKLIQYMACGLPVIGSPVGVNDKIILHGINGFKANNIEDWVKYFELLNENPDLAKKMGNEGRKFVNENYSLQNNFKNLLNIFSNSFNFS
jgi:glycosyltransferase involved in cell wall biosynthesis